MLRGLSVGDALLAREGRPLSDYAVIATNWNANVVRIDIHPGVWKHQDHALVLAELERQVQAIFGAGRYLPVKLVKDSSQSAPATQRSPLDS